MCNRYYLFSLSTLRISTFNFKMIVLIGTQYLILNVLLHILKCFLCKKKKFTIFQVVLILSYFRNFGNCLCLDVERKCFFYNSQVFHTLTIGSASPYVEPISTKEWQLHNLHKTFATCLIEQIACLAIERRVKNRCMFDQTHCLKRKWSLLASLLSRATVVSYEGYSQKNFSIPKFSEELETKLDTQDIRLSFQEWFHVYTWPSAALRTR